MCKWLIVSANACNRTHAIDHNKVVKTVLVQSHSFMSFSITRILCKEFDTKQGAYSTFTLPLSTSWCKQGRTEESISTLIVHSIVPLPSSRLYRRKKKLNH